MSQENDARREAEAAAARATENLKAKTEWTPEQQSAAEEKKANWQHQENDLRHVHGNAYTAAEKNAAHAETTNLSKQSFMSDEAKNELMKSISQDFDQLAQAVQQTQSQSQREQLQQQQTFTR